MSVHFQRAFLLYNQGNFEAAAKEFRQTLAEMPEMALAHAFLSLCLSNLDQNKEATEEAQAAIFHDPEESSGHFALAKAFYGRNRFKEAEGALQEAIRLAPHESYHYALLSSLKMQQSDWQGGLDAAEMGLEFEPEDPACNNLKAMALVKLGRKKEAGEALEGALERDPDDAFSHANQGWSYLHEGDPNKALEHFREALRLEPNLEFARLGMIESLKARYWIYRVILGYFLWMSKLSPQARWGVVIGLFFLQSFIASTARANPELEPYLDPILKIYLVFVITTWTAEPLSNLLLRLTRLGNMALTKEERVQSNWVGGVVGAALAVALYAIVSGGLYSLVAWLVAMNLVLLIFPISSYFSCSKGWPRKVMAVFGLAMVALMFLGIGLVVKGIQEFRGEEDQQSIATIKSGIDWLVKNTWLALISSFVGASLSGVRVKE